MFYKDQRPVNCIKLFLCFVCLCIYQKFVPMTNNAKKRCLFTKCFFFEQSMNLIPIIWIYSAHLILSSCLLKREADTMLVFLQLYFSSNYRTGSAHFRLKSEMQHSQKLFVNCVRRRCFGTPQIWLRLQSKIFGGESDEHIPFCILKKQAGVRFAECNEPKVTSN